MKTIVLSIAALTMALLPLATINAQTGNTGKWCFRDRDSDAYLYVDTRAASWKLTGGGRPEWSGSGLNSEQRGITLTLNHDRADTGEALAVTADLYERTHFALLRPSNSRAFQFYGEMYPVTAPQDCTCQK